MIFFTRFNRDPQYILRELFKKAQLSPYGMTHEVLKEAGFLFMKPALPIDVEVDVLATEHAKRAPKSGPKNSFILGAAAVASYIDQFTPVDARDLLAKDLIDNPLDFTVRQLSYLAPTLSRTPAQLIREVHNGLKPMQNYNWKSKYHIAQVHSKEKDEKITDLKLENGNLREEIKRLQLKTGEIIPSQNT